MGLARSHRNCHVDSAVDTALGVAVRLQAVAPERNGGAGVQPLRDVSNGAHRAGSGRAASVRQQRAAGGVKRSRAGGVIAKAPKS